MSSPEYDDDISLTEDTTAHVFEFGSVEVDTEVSFEDKEDFGGMLDHPRGWLMGMSQDLMARWMSHTTDLESIVWFGEESDSGSRTPTVEDQSDGFTTTTILDKFDSHTMPEPSLEIVSDLVGGGEEESDRND